MKIFKTKPNKYGWFYKFEYRKLTDDVKVILKNKDKDFMKKIYLGKEEAIELKNFINEVFKK